MINNDRLSYEERISLLVTPISYIPPRNEKNKNSRPTPISVLDVEDEKTNEEATNNETNEEATNNETSKETNEEATSKEINEEVTSKEGGISGTPPYTTPPHHITLTNAPVVSKEEEEGIDATTPRQVSIKTLRQECVRRGLPSTGKKSDIEKRLSEDVVHE